MPNIALQRFMVFNSGEGQGEGQEGEKLIFHWTKDSEEQNETEQINDICLCDACINVSDRLNENFENPLNDCTKQGDRRKSLILTFENAIIVVVQVEAKHQSIWIAAKVTVDQPEDTVQNQARSLSNNQPNNNNSSSIPAESIKRVIGNIYSRFRFLNGSFRMIINDIKQENDLQIIRNKLRLICREYFGSVLKSMHLNSILSNDITLYNQINYIDLNPITTLKVISFTNHLVCLSANKIRYILVIFNDQLIWSSLTHYDTRLLYNYLISDLIKNAVQEELSKEVDKVRRIKENFTIYLTESTVLEQQSCSPILMDSSYSSDNKTGSSERTIKEDHEELIDELDLKSYYMTVFRSSNLTLCLILDELNLADSIESTLTSALAALARHVGQDYLEVMRKQRNKTKQNPR